MVSKQKDLILVQSTNVNLRGFTLIELLIVISIIGVLSVIGMVAYTTFLKNARDAKRQSDLKFIQSALEEYHNDQIYYPSGSALNSPFTNATGAPTGTIATKTYMTQIPTEPVAGRASYVYVSSPTFPACDNSSTTTSCTSYCLYASGENLSNKTDDSIKCPVPLTFGGNSYNYAVTRP